MLRDPDVADAVLTSPSEGGVVTPPLRFAALERDIMRRTNALVNGSRVPLPWPRALGTPPWGALAELKRTGAGPGSDYRLLMLRPLSPEGKRAAYDKLLAGVRPSAPSLLYIGSATMPRHVTLVVSDPDDDMLLVYEPSSGRVTPMTPEDLVDTSRLGGWRYAWFAFVPRPAA